MPMLVHGTTRSRAEQILKRGPDPHFIEPESGEFGRAGSFSTYLEEGPFLFGPPDQYARNKASIFTDEGGPAIIAVDVPKDIIDLAQGPYFPLDQGLVQFDEGVGLDELIAAWPQLPKQIRLVAPE
jgi:hypothetical protein